MKKTILILFLLPLLATAQVTHYYSIKADTVRIKKSVTPSIGNTLVCIDTFGDYVTGSAGGGSGWGLTGNSGTNTTSNFIGTTDDNGLVFKVNNQFAGLLNPDYYNVSLGVSSNNNGGVNNVAIGYQALENTQVGFSATSNVAIGNSAMQSNITGQSNVAIGNYCLNATIDAVGNVAIGGDALVNNKFGSNNVAIGANAGYYGYAPNNRLFIDAYIRGGDSTTQEAQSLITGTFDADPLQQHVRFNAHVTIVDGTQGNGKVLTSDASGNASWQTPGVGSLQTATVTIPADSILTLFSAPNTLVPAQGAGTLIVPTNITYYLSYGTATYATNTSLKVSLGVHNINTNSNFLGNTSNALYQNTTTAIGGESGSFTVVNTPLLIQVTGGNPTISGTGGTLKVTVLYYVVNLN